MAHNLLNSQKKFLCPWPKKIPTFILILIHLLTLSPLFAASPAKQSKTSSFGTTLRLGWYSKPAPLDPFKVSDTISVSVMYLIFNRLVRYDQKGDFQPELAERWQISNDGLAYTFFLKKNVRFHNGQLFTAKDVAYTFKLSSDPAINPAYYTDFALIRSWEVLNDFTIRITLKEPYSPFLLILWRVRIIPDSILDSTTLEDFIKRPIGTGPFIFESQNSDGEMKLKANKDYFEGSPHVNGMQIKIFPSKTQVWSAFLRGDIDMIFYLNHNDYKEIKDNPSFQIFRTLSAAGYALMFNVKDPMLASKKVRTAIAYAINRQELIENLEAGEGILTDSLFHPHSWAYLSGKVQAFDPEKTKAILREEGFVEKGQSWVKDGKELALNLLLDPKNENFVRMAKMLRQQLQEAGIKIYFKFFADYKDLQEKVYQKNSEFQAYLFTFNTGPEPDTVRAYAQTSAPYNWGSYSNEKVDSLFELASKKYKLEERAEAYKQVQLIMEDERPTIFFYIPYVFHATSNKISNAENLFGPFIPFYALKDIYKKEERG